MRSNDVEPFILWVSRASDGRRGSLPIDYHDVALPEPISGDRNINLATLRPRKISAIRREPEKETGLAYRNLFLSGRVPPNDLNGGLWHAEMASEKLYDCLIGLTVLRRGVNRNPVLTSGDLCDGLDLGSRLDRYPDPGVHGLR